MKTRLALPALFLAFLTAVGALSGDELDRILARYVESMGGRGRLADINSIVLEGTYTHPSGTVSGLRVMKKRPNLVRSVLLRPNGARIVNGYDGEVAWQEFSNSSSRQVEIVSGPEADAFIRDAPLETPLAAEGFDRSRISYLGTAQIEGGITCHHLKIQYENGAWVEHFLDTQNYYERKTVKHQVIDGKETVEYSLPSDFRYVEGVVFAYRIIFRDSEDQRSELNVSEIRINSGLLNSVFSAPALEAEG